MLTAIISAVLSAVCMALMVVTDRLMVGDCYRGKPMHAWFVSSLAGSIFGLILTACIWIAVGYTDFGVSFSTLFEMAGNLLLWKGIATLCIGALGSQLLLHYFRCFSENANATVMAAWIASTPIFVFALMLGITLLGFPGLSTTSTDPLWIFGIILATSGLVAFEFLSGEPSGDTTVYRRELLILIALNTLYTVGLKQIFTIDPGNSATLTEAIALMPFYWLGFALGTRGMLKKGEWASFRSNWQKRIRYFFVPIFFLEVIGMLVFFFEYVSLTALDPTLVSIILGAHIVLVYLCDVLLGWYRTRMAIRGERRTYVLGIRLIQSKLPEPERSTYRAASKVTVIFIIMLGIAIVMQYL